MEITKDKQLYDLGKDVKFISNGVLTISVFEHNKKISCGTVYPDRIFDEWKPSEDYLNLCRETELLLTGEGRNFAARSRSLGGCGEKLNLVDISDQNCSNGKLFTIEYFREDINLRVFSKYLFPCPNLPIVRRWVDLRNEGTEDIDIEQISSLSFYHIGMIGELPWHEKLRFLIPYSNWSGEGQWKKLTPTQLGLTSPNASHYRASCLGSRSSAEKSPCAMLQDIENDITWFWQIENSSSWTWEIGLLEVQGSQHGLYLQAGGPDEDHGHWWKNLRPGQSFSSVPVAFGCVKGGFEESVSVLTKYRRQYCRKPHPQDDNLPVIFNDYNNCLWGNPTYEAELPLIKAASAVGCEYYCIDSAWYASPDEHWWPGVGHWKVNNERFPDGKFFKLINFIKSCDMVPGLWLEAEVVGVNNLLSKKPDDWFYTRHGKRIEYNGRFFLNFSNPEVIEYLNSVIDRIVLEYGIGYIKNDYNIDMHLGTETGGDSFGDGLLNHTRNLYDWIDSIHKKYPDLIWENCAAGGLRTDYGILSHAQLQSSSDLDNFTDYSALVIGCSALVLPEQLAVWSYPLASDDQEATIYNMINSILCRIHLSGQLADLDKPCSDLVKEAIKYYRDNRYYMKNSLPFYPLGMPSILQENFWLALGMKSDSILRLAVWRNNSDEDSCLVPLYESKGIYSVECVYPTSEEFKPQWHLTDEGIVFKFEKKVSARLFEIRVNE